MAKDTTSLRALLALEQFPLTYLHKFIGKNTPAFHAAVAAMEARFPSAVRVTVRLSGVNQTYVAYTLSLNAKDPEEIVALWSATADLAELTLIL